MSNFKIATFNANSLRARLDIILDWLRAENPDVLCVQETKVQDQDFPAAAFEEAGWAVAFHGQKSYNGVAVVSREPLEDVRTDLGPGEEPPAQARFLAGVYRGLSVVNTYVPQGFEPGSEKFQYKLDWLRRVRVYFETHHDPGHALIWTGDINVAPEPRDVYDPDKLAGSCGFHPDEQAALKHILDWGLVDVFRKHVPDEQQFTFWDYRLRGGVKRNLGWRIDHIFATRPLADKSRRAWIDTAPRLLPKPSDHTFLAAEFDV